MDEYPRVGISVPVAELRIANGKQEVARSHRQRPNQASYIGELPVSAGASSLGLNSIQFMAVDATPWTPGFSIPKSPSPPWPESKDKNTSTSTANLSVPSCRSRTAKDRRLRPHRATGREYRSLAAEVTAPNNTKPLCCGRIRGTKDDRVWAAARTAKRASNPRPRPVWLNRPMAPKSPAHVAVPLTIWTAVDPELHLGHVPTHTRTFASACAMPLGACIMDWPGRLASSD
ncbi:hypothetical protein TRIATDRAFT_88654 [Trichoderma atroviride IMI 206040]|uniref:Uncharacterized protein n=1 Tax=Hypocrea atroviridis (strain ATCC 20476 / IMI 206040) TaxID=452589 RepID=G9NTB8_HYPAI|nr:uncharacterized protein TRIATDRAFT_88654 [Trichoderma atroviride IMI 206040]EHK45963.1 hypothetical protein TRIATDRAFT_88654 [Trichoderma atroviride IMI 206040]